jgi:hypothetical protein
MDGISWLTKRDRKSKESLKLLAKLQDLAKVWADESKVKVVFISSTASSVLFLQNRPFSWSRCYYLIEVGDVSFEEAVKYLENKGISSETARICVSEITGGRVDLLRQVVHSFSQKLDYEEIKKEHESQAFASFLRSGFHLPNEEGECVRSIIKALLESKDGTLDVTSPIIQQHRQDLFPDLVECQLIAYHPFNNSVTFYSQRVATLAKEQVKKYALS